MTEWRDGQAEEGETQTTVVVQRHRAQTLAHRANK